jgi:aspartyl-tRNA(Asn)/glutamyl-tRNA(Gln) amidotransferase subunit A
MSDLTTISGAAAALRAGEVSATELVERSIAASDAMDEKLGLFLARFQSEAQTAAKEIDSRLAAGEEVGPLAGIPLGIKDIITTTEGPTTAQSLVHDPWAITGDAVVVQRLRAAGGVIMGKLTTMEFAVGLPDADKPFPIPRNPWNSEHWTGGSSSGSASAVASGAVLGSLGTDTGGSIRIPAAFCGITGLMPTYGRVPKSGCVPLGFSTDHIGPMTRSARDAALLLSVLAGYHPSDSTAIEEPTSDYVGALTGDLTGVRIGVDRLTAYFGRGADPGLAPALELAIGALKARGAEVFDVELPFYHELSFSAVFMFFAEAMAYHRPDLQTRWTDYFAASRATIGLATFITAADYVQMQRVRQMVVTKLAALYKEVDLVLTPTVGVGAPGLTEIAEPTFMSTLEPLLATPYWDAAGNPVISVPMGFTADGLPLGFQLAGRPFDEALVLKAADAYQQDTDWHLRTPPIAAF